MEEGGARPGEKVVQTLREVRNGGVWMYPQISPQDGMRAVEARWAG